MSHCHIFSQRRGCVLYFFKVACVIIRYKDIEKAKPVVRQGRKAMGLRKIARLPIWKNEHCSHTSFSSLYIKLNVNISLSYI